MSLALRERLGEGVAGELEGGQVMDEEPAAPMSSAPLQVEAGSAVLSAADDVQLDDPGLAVMKLTAQEKQQHLVQVIIQVKRR